METLSVTFSEWGDRFWQCQKKEIKKGEEVALAVAREEAQYVKCTPLILSPKSDPQKCCRDTVKTS